MAEDHAPQTVLHPHQGHPEVSEADQGQGSGPGRREWYVRGLWRYLSEGPTATDRHHHQEPAPQGPPTEENRETAV